MGLGHQLGELFLGAVPTVLILIVLYFILKSLFFKPLLAVMAEREKRTAGAQRAAEGGQAGGAGKGEKEQKGMKKGGAKGYCGAETGGEKLVDEGGAVVKALRELATAGGRAAK